MFPTSFDLIGISSLLLEIGYTFLTLFACFRAIEFGRAFVKSVYRRRAFWIAIMLLSITLSNIVSIVPTLSNSALAGFIFFGMILVIFAFVDGAVLVARETDFFHRDMFGWMRVRLAAYVAMVASAVAGVVSLFVATPDGILAILLIAFDLVIPVVFTYSTAALLIGARRTPDLTLKRHVKFLAVALALFVAIFVVSSAGTDLAFLLGDAFSLVSIYFLYLAVMALSPIAKVVPEAGDIAMSRPPVQGGNTLIA